MLVQRLMLVGSAQRHSAQSTLHRVCTCKTISASTARIVYPQFTACCLLLLLLHMQGQGACTLVPDVMQAIDFGLCRTLFVWADRCQPVLYSDADRLGYVYSGRIKQQVLTRGCDRCNVWQHTQPLFLVCLYAICTCKHNPLHLAALFASQDTAALTSGDQDGI